MNTTNYELLLQELQNNNPPRVEITNNSVGCSYGFMGWLRAGGIDEQMINNAYELANKSEKLYAFQFVNRKVSNVNMKNKGVLDFENCDLSDLEFTDTGRKVWTLYFGNCKGIKGFSIIENIHTLHLCEMNLSEINVNEIKDIKFLVELEIRYCKLTKVPKFVDELQNIERLSLCNNIIYKLPKSASTWKFELHIWNNPICNKLNGKPITMENLIAISDMVRFRKFLARYFAIVHHMPYDAIKSIMLFSLC